MKKKNFKLSLNKVEISSLSHVKGGVGEIETVSRNFIDLCCLILGTNECPNTEQTTCHSGAPNCDNHSDDCHASYRSHCSFTDC